MKMLKKVTAVLAVLLLVLGTMSIGAVAAGETGTIGITIRADKTDYLYPGDIVTFTMNVSTNFNYIGMRWPVMYSLKAFEPVHANDGFGDADYGNVIGNETLSDPNSYIESSEASTNEPFGSGYSKTNYGCLLIQWTGGASGNSVIYYNEPTGADCLTFQLRVKEGYTANGGVGTVVVPTTDQVKSLLYLDGITTPTNGDTTYHISLENLTFTSEPCQVHIIKEMAGLDARGDTVIDTTGPINYIYGLNAAVNQENEQLYTSSTIQRHTMATGNAKIELWSVEEVEHPATFDDDPTTEKLISTGAKLKLYDASGKFLDEYTFVIFGDINGDGVLDGADSSLLTDGFLYMEEWSWGNVNDNALFFSCDINGDGVVMSDDVGPLVEAMGSKGYINQTHDPDNFFVYY